MADSFQQLTLVDFFAHWCGPCMNMMPIIDQVKDLFGDQLRILKVDVDKNVAACSTYQIKGVPTFILFREGKILWTKVGGLSKQELIQAIEQQLIP